MGQQMYFMISLFILYFIFTMECVFLVKLFHHMVVTTDKWPKIIILNVFDATSVS